MLFFPAFARLRVHSPPNFGENFFGVVVSRSLKKTLGYSQMEFFISSLDIDDAYIVQVPSLGNESLNLQNTAFPLM